MAKLNVTLKRSPIGSTQTQRRTLEALGLKKLNQTVTQPDNDGTRGQVAKVAHLVSCVTIEE